MPLAETITRVRAWSGDASRLSSLREILASARAVPSSWIRPDATGVLQQFEAALNRDYLYAVFKARPRITPQAVQVAPRRIAPWDFDPPRDHRVNEITNDALRRAANSNGFHHLSNAWGLVQSWRECCGIFGWEDEAAANLNYAAADHYLQNRFYSMGGGAVPAPFAAIGLAIAVPVYDALKATFGVFRSGSGHPSPASSFVRDWAGRGVVDGLAARAVSAVSL